MRYKMYNKGLKVRGLARDITDETKGSVSAGPFYFHISFALEKIL